MINTSRTQLKIPNYKLIPKTNKKLKMGLKNALIVKQTKKTLVAMAEVLEVKHHRQPNIHALHSRLLKCTYSNLIKALEEVK